MKILIGYDGSKSAEASLDDLQGAGLPADCEALVFSIAEVWLPQQSFNGNGSGIKFDAEPKNTCKNTWRKTSVRFAKPKP